VLDFARTDPQPWPPQDLAAANAFAGLIVTTLQLATAGQQQALSQITFLPDADVLYRRVSALLFSSDWGGAASSGDDEGNTESRTSPRRSPGEGGRQDTEPIPRLPPRQE
jgi:hypothetical protein